MRKFGKASCFEQGRSKGAERETERGRRGGRRGEGGGGKKVALPFCAHGVAVRLACPSQRVRHNEESIVATETPYTYVRFPSLPVIRYIRRDGFPQIRI